MYSTDVITDNHHFYRTIMKSSFFKQAAIVLLSLPLFYACDGGLFNSDDDFTPAEVDTVRNLPADPPVSIGPMGPVGTGKYTFFNFETNAIVANSDSATNKWDIGFRATSIIFNSGVSGPGVASAQIVDGIFNELTIAPEAGYKIDATGAFVIPGISGQGWYTYTGPAGNPANVILPVPGRIIVVKTNEGNYVKMEILSYYRDNPPVSTLTQESPSRYMTFRFALQADGSRDF
jgi:hypothetical protein